MAGIRQNREILTGGKKYHTKQVKKFGVDEVKFDRDSRQEYLTGFHKRKLQRQKNAQVYIKEQERLAKVEERRQIREERKKDLENQLKGFKETIQKISHLDSSDEENEAEKGEWDGFDSNSADKSDDEENSDEEVKKINQKAPQKGILHHRELYKKEASDFLPEGDAIIDDETTVTVESMDNPHIQNVQNANLEAIARANNVDLQHSEEILKESINRAKNYAVVCGVAKPSAKDKVKKKNKKFRYLTKAERRDNNRKAKAKKLKSNHREKS